MHLLDNVPHCDQLSCLLPHKQQLLLHCISSRVPVHEHKGGGGEGDANMDKYGKDEAERRRERKLVTRSRAKREMGKRRKASREERGRNQSHANHVPAECFAVYPSLLSQVTHFKPTMTLTGESK